MLAHTTNLGRVTPAPAPADGHGRSGAAETAADALPVPLRVAAALVALQGLALAAYAVLEVVSLRSGRATMALTTAFFFAVFAAFLLLAARGLRRRRSWARGPVVFAQLLWLGVAWSFRGGDTTWVALLLALMAAVVMAGVLSPSGIAALEAGRGEPVDG